MAEDDTKEKEALLRLFAYVVEQFKRHYRWICALSAVFGIVVGKYLSFVHILEKGVGEQAGEWAASEVSWFSKDVVGLFINNFTIVLSGWDILLVALAVTSAWRMPQTLVLLFPGRERG